MATEKQKRAIEKIVENRGNISRAMLEAGYSPNSAKNPKNLTQSKLWQKLMDKHLPDDKLAKIHKEQLEAKTIRSMPFHYKLKDNEIKKIIESEGFKFISTKRFMTTAIVFFSINDVVAIDKALDKAYKLKGKYSSELWPEDNSVSEIKIEIRRNGN